MRKFAKQVATQAFIALLRPEARRVELIILRVAIAAVAAKLGVEVAEDVK